MNNRNFLFCFAIALCLAGALGCTEDSGKTNATPAPMEERIKAIQNRTDMPEQFKTMAIQQLKAHEAAGQQGAGAVKTPAASPSPKK